MSGLILIGLRGSGKSTAGRYAAERLGWSFTDLDDVTPTVAGFATAGELLRTQGEPAFRAAEAQALAQSLPLRRSVLALGGGTPTAPGCADLIRRQRCARVYLRCRPETLAERLGKTDIRTRPSLTGQDPLTEIAEIFDRRDGLYQTLGTVFNADGLDLDTVIDRLVTLAQRGEPD